MDPHIPYMPPPPFDARFDPQPTADAPGRDPREEADPAAHRDAYVARYDGEVAYGDREFGRFVRGMPERTMSSARQRRVCLMSNAGVRRTRAPRGTETLTRSSVKRSNPLAIKEETPSRQARGPPWKTAAHLLPASEVSPVCRCTDWSPISCHRPARTCDLISHRVTPSA